MSALRIVALVGPHNSGKTGLVVYLARALCREGCSVGVLKRAARPLDFDRAGKDSARYLDGGSVRVITQAPGMLYTQHVTLTHRTPLEVAKEYGRDIDWWLVESYEPEALPWVLVTRRGQPAPELDAHCLATFGARHGGALRPHFPLGRPALLCAFLKGRLGEGSGRV